MPVTPGTPYPTSTGRNQRPAFPDPLAELSGSLLGIITVSKRDHKPSTPGGEKKFVVLEPSTTKVEKLLKFELNPLPLKENIIFVGSQALEGHVIFWSKLCFMGAAYFQSRNTSQFRPADRNTLAYVDNKYTATEKKLMSDLFGVSNTKVLSTSSDIIALFHSDSRVMTVAGLKRRIRLQDVAFFCHGYPLKLALNDFNPKNPHPGETPINFREAEVKGCNENAFLPNGRIYSYACRTGIAVDGDPPSDAEAGLDRSLAQIMADHYGISVFAFLRRSEYEHTLYTQQQDQRIRLHMPLSPPDSDLTILPGIKALYHPHVNSPDKPQGFPHAKYANHALWLDNGSWRLPYAAASPEGVSADFREFVPGGKP